jgi:hypothetical protein
LGFSLLIGLLAPQQPQNSDFPSNFSELLNRTVEVGPSSHHVNDCRDTRISARII